MRQSDLIVKTLLDAKNRMEKKQSVSARFMQRARDANPVNSVPALKALQDLQTLKHATGEARKTAAASLAKTLLAPPKRKSGHLCKKCGAQITSGITFCGDCGNRVT